MKKTAILLFSLVFTAGTALAQVNVDINKCITCPVIDGVEEYLWENVSPVYLEKNLFLEVPDITAYWKACYNDTAIYVLMHVEDDDFYPAEESGGNHWEYDKDEIYFDLNDTLAEGEGPITANSGHWQCSAELFDSLQGIESYEVGWEGHFPNNYHSWMRTGENHVREWRIPTKNMWDKNYNKLGLQKMADRIGFDAYVIDRDEDMTGRTRKVWQQDGKTTGDEHEAWESMDHSGTISFIGGGFNNRDITTDTVLCGFSKITLVSFEIPADASSYAWKTDGAIRDNDRGNCWIEWNSAGEKTVQLIVGKLSGGTDTLARKIIIYPSMSISIPVVRACRLSEFTLVPVVRNGIRPFRYYWNGSPGDSVYTGSIQDNNNQYIGLEVFDNAGCYASYYGVIYPFIKQTPPGICHVTVDASTNKNKIVWQKPDEGIREFKIYRESSVAGQYTEIGTVDAVKEAFYVDSSSQPSKYADIYKLMTVDTCDNTSDLSEPHQPIHLQISTGLSGSINLNWSPYHGFDYSTYFIYKGYSVDHMKLIDSVSTSKTQYTDTASGFCFYQIGVRSAASCNSSHGKSTTLQFNEARSNIETSVETQQVFNLYPIPFSDVLTLESYLDRQQTVTIEIYNLLGVKLYEYGSSEVAGLFTHAVNVGNLGNSNLYMVKIKLDGEVRTMRIIRSRRK